MNTFNQLLAVLIALALLSTMIVGGYMAIEYIAAVFLGMDPQVARVTGVASAAVLLAALLVASSIRRANTQNRIDQINAEKAAAYRRFLDTWTRVLQEPAGRVNPRTIQSSDVLQTLNQSLVLYGSTEIIKTHTALLAQLAAGGVQDLDIRSQFTRALLNVRKDLGSDSRGLTADHLLNLLFRNGCEPGSFVHREGAELQSGSSRRPAETS